MCLDAREGPVKITKEHLDDVGNRYLHAWKSLARASGPGTHEYPLEAHASHLLANTMAPQPSEQDEPVLESYYWRKQGARYGRADIWIPDAGATLGTFIEVKLAGLWGKPGRIGRANAEDVLGWWAKDIFRLVAGSMPPEAQAHPKKQKVDCAFVVVGLGSFTELQRAPNASPAPDGRPLRELKASLEGRTKKIVMSDSHTIPAAFITLAADAVRPFAVPKSVSFVVGGPNCTDDEGTDLKDRRCVQAMALCWTQRDVPA